MGRQHLPAAKWAFTAFSSEEPAEAQALGRVVAFAADAADAHVDADADAVADTAGEWGSADMRMLRAPRRSQLTRPASPQRRAARRAADAAHRPGRQDAAGVRSATRPHPCARATATRPAAGRPIPRVRRCGVYGGGQAARWQRRWFSRPPAWWRAEASAWHAEPRRAWRQNRAGVAASPVWPSLLARWAAALPLPTGPRVRQPSAGVAAGHNQTLAGYTSRRSH